ncbi:hypothetical protein ACJX0J_042014, partial [Zea mays]
AVLRLRESLERNSPCSCFSDPCPCAAPIPISPPPSLGPSRPSASIAPAPDPGLFFLPSRAVDCSRGSDSAPAVSLVVAGSWELLGSGSVPNRCCHGEGQEKQWGRPDRQQRRRQHRLVVHRAVGSTIGSESASVISSPKITESTADSSSVTKRLEEELAKGMPLLR